MNWKNSVNKQFGTVSITSINNCLNANAYIESAPIDSFYESSQAILRIATPNFFVNYPSLGPFLLIGVISSTENYFRELFTRIIQICPVAKKKSADQTIKLGSITWHSTLHSERSIFEHISFADADKVKSSTSKYIGVDLRSSPIYDQFDKVCQLRHAIVHSNNIIAGINAINLQIPKNTSPLYVKVGFDELQEFTAICTSLVSTVNTELFEKISERWAVAWRRLPSWIPGESNQLFKRLWALFFSQKDFSDGTITDQMGMVKCRNLITNAYGIT